MMKKKLKRLIVAGLVASMIAPLATAGIDATAAVPKAQEESISAEVSENNASEKYAENKAYTFKYDELEMDETSTKTINGGTDVTVDATGATFVFKGQYAQVFYKVPEGINSKRIKSIEVVGADTTKFSVKAMGTPGVDSTEQKAAYDSNILLTPEGFDFNYIVLMTTNNGGTYTSTELVITLGDEPAGENETKTKLSQCEIVMNGGATVSGNTVTFTKGYQSVFFKVPADVDTDLLAKIEIKGDAGTGFNYKVMTPDLFQNHTWENGLLPDDLSNPMVFDAGAGVEYFVIMSGENEPYGSFSLDSDVIFTVEPPSDVQMDIPSLKNTVVSANGLGKDAYVATCISGSTVKDPKAVQLVKKHFNAVTLENELKPEGLLGTVSANDITDTFKGEPVPKGLHFETPDAILDEILEWNKEDGVDIKVRGHVLTWHSQTPEEFFHVDYDTKKDDVTPEVMAIRQEWYIKTVMEHYFGEGSKYKDLFYGFDVVNEACSDSTRTYRSAAEGSSWARIYKNVPKDDAPDYILNAFRFANKYAPETLELYYNDYNDCSAGKVDAIANLLRSVKKHEKDATLPTRITGFGMQGHHEIDFPTKQQVIDAATLYGSIVGKVQVTELDFKSSKNYDGSKAMQPAENTKTAYRYRDVYQAYVEVDQLPDIDVNGFTVWGTHDAVSWLNTFNGAGGGADGRPQSPLLFDKNYQAKPAFWGIVDPSKLEPIVNTVDAIQTNDGSFDNGTAYTFGSDGINVEFTPVWTPEKVMISVNVSGATLTANDSVTLYYEDAKGEIKTDVAKGTEVASKIFEIPGTFTALNSVRFDIVVKAGNKTIVYNDTDAKQAERTKYYAEAILKPYADIRTGSAVIDGKADEIWAKVDAIPLTIQNDNPKASASAKLMWDQDNLYVFMDVKDAILDDTSANAWEQDSMELFIDENNEKTGSYQEDDKQYRINYKNVQSFNPSTEDSKCNADNVKSVATEVEGGYTIEAAFKWTDIKAAAGTNIGLELQVNDAENGGRIGNVSWFDTSGQGYQNTGVFGTATLSNLKPGEKPATDDKKDDTKDDKKDDKKDETKPEVKPEPAKEEVKAAEKVEKGAAKEAVDKLVTATKSSSDVKGADYVSFKSQSSKVSASTAKISWDKIKGAASYVVYGAENGKTFENLGEVTATNFTQKELKKGTEYSYMVVAYDKDGKAISATKTITVTTTGGKYTDAKKVKLKSKKKVTLKKGRKSKVKATIVKAAKKGKLKNKKLTYVSSNSKVATVSKKGQIKAKKKGKCVIYVYAKNGKRAQVKVTVK